MSQELKAVVQALVKLTTQVRRVADTLADGTGQDSFALAPPVVTNDDGAQTTGDDAPPLTVRRIAHWGPPCESGRHPAHANQTCQEMEATAALVQDWAQRAADRARRQEFRRLVASVQGRCPACGGTSLYLGDGGYITCPRDTCPQPDAASTLLEQQPNTVTTATWEGSVIATHPDATADDAT